MTRWMHPPELERQGDRNQFDPVVEGSRYDLSRELSLEIWQRVSADATDSAGRWDEEQAQQRFRELAARIAARGGRLRPGVGRLTRVGVELYGDSLGTWRVDELRARTPGRTTLVSVETRRWATMGEVQTANPEGNEATERRELPGTTEVTRAMAALQATQRLEHVTPIPPEHISPSPSQGTWLTAHPLWQANVAKPSLPGRRSLVDTTNSRLGFDDYRVLGLKEVLQRLGPDPLRRELIAAAAVADRPVVGRATLWREPLPSTTTPTGHALWHAAERHSATLYRHAISSGAVDQHDPAVELALQRCGTGQPIPMELRREMERGIGVSLAGVRIHIDAVAAQATRAVNAKAFTVGEDIFFAEGAYMPETPAGRELFAHELAHVVQLYQGRIMTGGVGIRVSSPSESLEREADAIADRIGAQRSDYPDHSGSKVGSQGAPPRSVSKQVPALSTPRREIAAATSGPLILRQAAPTRPLAGQPVQKHGIVYRPEGVNLREQASPNGRVLQQLAFNTRVFVDSQEGSWFFVTTSDGKFGYCADTHVKVNLPEPDAKIHWIKSGETALSISQKYYGGKAEWGSDHRFYVNGLVYTNQGKGKRGIFKPDAKAGWDTTQVLADYMIWIPSLSFMKSLHGKISSGSITYEAWQSAKTAAEAVGEFLLGTGAFIAGVLHGALESLWDVLVGLKDLAVMIWDIVKSIFTGNLLSDAEGLWHDLRNLDWKKLVTGWINEFDGKWNDDSILKRWHFRGWVTGYVVMEVLMLFFSEGVIQGIKWVGKASKVTKVIQKLPRLQKLAETVKAGKAYQKVAKVLAKGGEIASKPADAIKWIERLLVEPKSIWGKGPDEIAEVFRKAGHEVVVEQSKKGSKLSQQIRIKGGDINNIQVHPGGGRHGGAYYKISSSSKGVIKVVDKATYVAAQGEKATIIFMSGPEGWLLQAAAANSAAQNAGQEISEQMDTKD